MKSRSLIFFHLFLKNDLKVRIVHALISVLQTAAKSPPRLVKVY
jgi:hypothetical protein